jgi:hypothetical protein
MVSSTYNSSPTARASGGCNLSDCLRTLQEFLLVDVQAEGLKVENIYVGGAPKLISAASVALVAKQGGTLTYSPAYTPEMNGLAERGNQTAYNGG